MWGFTTPSRSVVQEQEFCQEKRETKLLIVNDDYPVHLGGRVVWRHLVPYTTNWNRDRRWRSGSLGVVCGRMDSELDPHLHCFSLDPPSLFPLPDRGFFPSINKPVSSRGIRGLRKTTTGGLFKDYSQWDRNRSWYLHQGFGTGFEWLPWVRRVFRPD